MAKTPKIGNPEQQCHGKNGYLSKKRAKLAIRRMYGRRRKLVVYRCPHCNYFHIGGEW